MSPVEVIEARIAELRAMRENYMRYWQDRVKEQDLHACWDAAIDINLADYEIKGLEFALGVMKQ